MEAKKVTLFSSSFHPFYVPICCWTSFRFLIFHLPCAFFLPTHWLNHLQLLGCCGQIHRAEGVYNRRSSRGAVNAGRWKLLLFNLQNVSLPWGLFYIRLLQYGPTVFFSSVWEHRNWYSSYATAIPLTSGGLLSIQASEIRINNYVISLFFTNNGIKPTGVITERQRIILALLLISDVLEHIRG